MAKPLLRYAGGKRWAIKVVGQPIQDHLSTTGGRFIDPFLGGGAIPLWLGAERMLLGDLLEPLVEMYQVVKERPGELARNLSAVAILGVSKEDYERVRDMRPKTPVGRAARFIYLNRLCFNGIVRYNKEGNFNVPYAKDAYRQSMVERGGRDAIESLFPNNQKFHDVSKALRGAELYCGDYRHLVNQADEGDVLYLDPPYHNTFNGYTGEGFPAAAQACLADEARQAAARGAMVVAHNSGTPEVREWWSWAHDIGAKEKRQINSDVNGRQKVRCTLWTNHPDLFEDW